MANTRNDKSESTSKRPKRLAKTLDARENEMITLAVDLAEKQMREQTASAQVITHFLKLGTSRERLEQEKLAKENLLLQTRAEQIASAANVEELYKQALSAMRSYNGQVDDETINDEY